MQLFFHNLGAGMEFIPRLTLTGIIEILIISWMAYAFLTWVMDTKAWILLRGLLLIVAFVGFCTLFHLNTILWLMGQVATIAVTALIIIFQPELRSALEQLGNRNFLVFLNSLLGDTKQESLFSAHTVNELVKASFEMGKVKTGALMVIEQKISLNDIVRTGIDIDGIVSNQLLINIFEHNTPLHDGAVVIRGNTIVSATCYLPLSESMRISKDLGTRHRAAIGVSEATDAVTIVVSEETGRVSVARNGQLRVMQTPEELRALLLSLSDAEVPTKHFTFNGWDFLKGKEKHERENTQ